MMEWLVGVAVVGVLVLVGFAVATLIQVQKTMADLRPLVAQLNSELPALVRETRQTVAIVNAAALDAKGGIEHAAVLLHAVGEVGETVQQVHGLVRGRGESLLGRAGILLTGVRAASAVIRDRLTKRNGNGLDDPATPY